MDNKEKLKSLREELDLWEAEVAKTSPLTPERVDALDRVKQLKAHIKMLEPVGGSMDEILIVARHPGLVEFLESKGVTGEVITHATPEAVRGKHVVGVLPLHLAVEAASVTEVVLTLTPEQRGKELSMEEVRQAFQGFCRFRVLHVPSLF